VGSSVDGYEIDEMNLRIVKLVGWIKEQRTIHETYELRSNETSG